MCILLDCASHGHLCDSTSFLLKLDLIMMKMCLTFAICFVVGWDEGVAKVIKNKMFLMILDHQATR